MSGRVRRLYDLEIDEISLVDRPANQHGKVAIAKRAEDHVATYIDANGDEVDLEDIEFGEYVTDPESGQTLYMASPDELAELGIDPDDDEGGYADPDDEYVDEDDPELVGVGKARIPRANMISGGGEMARTARFQAGRGGTKVRGSMGPGRGTRARAGARNAASGARGLGESAWGNRNTRRTAAGVGGAAAVGGSYAAGRKVNKSLGQSVLEELSKALDNGDRDEVISKMGDMIESANRSASRAWNIAKSVQEQQEARDYAALADTYELPVDPEVLGGILQSVSKALDDDQLAILDRVLQAGSVGFDELGYSGSGESDVMGEVMAVARETVGKSDFSEAQAVSALFDANPDLYDQYCAENA